MIRSENTRECLWESEGGGRNGNRRWSSIKKKKKVTDYNRKNKKIENIKQAETEKQQRIRLYLMI